MFSKVSPKHLYWMHRLLSMKIDSENGNKEIYRATGVNSINNERTIFDLELARGWIYSIKNSGKVPKAAIDGLKNSIVKCNRSPKQLQNEADQLNNYLRQRLFPAPHELVKQIRREVKEKLEDQEEFGDDGFYSETRTSKMQCNREVKKVLARMSCNWRPLGFNSKESAAVYSLARFAANYTEVFHVLSHFKLLNFTPESVLDYGSGSCAAFWACNEIWGDGVKEYQLIEPNEFAKDFGMDTLRNNGIETDQPLVHPNITFRRHLVPSPEKKFDLVIAHRVLIEFASRESRLDILHSLWHRTNRFLVLIDSGAKNSFEAIIEARDYLITMGYDVHAEECLRQFQELGIDDTKVVSILENEKLSNYEQFTLLKEMLPENASPPTRLPRCFVFAPCPHDQGCPKLSSGKTCRFNVRWTELRADGKKPQNPDGTISDHICYIILDKGVDTRNVNASRILETRRYKKQINCTLCTPFLGVQTFVISHRMKKIYKTVSERKEDELIHLKMKSVGTESVNDVYDQAVLEYAGK